MRRRPGIGQRRLAVVAAVAAALTATGVALAATLGVTSTRLTTWEAATTVPGCFAPGTQTVTADADTFVIEDKPTDTNGSTSPLEVKANASKNRRALLHFPLPSLPSGCTVTLATLRLKTTTYKGGLVYEAYRLASGFVEATATWANQPATSGLPATTVTINGWVEWTVTTQVQALYSVSNTGLLVKDAVEGTGATSTNKYSSREGGDPPQLVVTYG